MTYFLPSSGIVQIYQFASIFHFILYICSKRSFYTLWYYTIKHFPIICKYSKDYEIELNSFLFCIKSRLGKIKDIREVTKSNAHLFPSYLATKALQYDEITSQHAVTRGLLRVDLIIQGWMWWALSGGH